VTAATVTGARLWHGLDDVPAGFGPCAVTIGVFDGVHRGHVRVIERAVAVGLERGLPTVLVTFDPHPARVVGSPRDTAALSTPGRRAELAGELGVDAVLVLPFTAELAGTCPDDFVRRVLVDALGARAVIMGSDFRFGARGAGDVTTLAELGRRHRFTADGVDLLSPEGVRCSSTLVRTCLASGDVAGAARVLGRPHRVEGRLAGGVLAVPPGTAVPAAGRYPAVLTRSDARVCVEAVVEARGAIRVPGGPAGDGVVSLDFLPEGAR
jgi:riboflavin kinase/FMN adenylyltransferase